MRSLDEIMDAQEVVLQKHPTLIGLDSTSDVSFFAQMRKMWALLVQMVESDWGNLRTEIELKIATTSVGSLSWYVDQVKAFQFGDQVSIINGQVAYDVPDDQKRIVVQAAGTEDLSTGRLNLKAAKKGPNGLIPLNVEELEALKTYVGKVKYAGVVVDVISMDADDLKITATVKVDRQVISLTGSLLTDTSKLPVHDAISAYLTALPYDSVLSNTGLTDALQSIRGVKDFTITSSFTRRPISSTWVAYSREVISQAGHLRLHPDSTINFTY